MEIVELCKKYQHEGVVAIDLAGDELLCSETKPHHRWAYEVSGALFCEKDVDRAPVFGGYLDEGLLHAETKHQSIVHDRVNLDSSLLNSNLE